MNAVVMRDRRLTIREIAEEVGLSTFSAHSIVTEDLAMKRVSAKFVFYSLWVKSRWRCMLEFLQQESFSISIYEAAREKS